MKKILGKFLIKIKQPWLTYQAKKISMQKEDLGNILATQLIECVANRKYGYMSGVGPKFSHLTDDGVALMNDLLARMVSVAHEIHENDIKNRTEQLVMDNLKK